ncbi:CHAT domain-containing protein [Micromonospora rifamycinica]|uniref:CHAT domain-containing protein n=1 Tax=Micromonospora rifamycinica TaxID=291594 RepID=UPI0033D815AF
MLQASDEGKIDQSLAETLNRLRARRRPPRKVLLQLQLAEALLERSGRATPQRTDEDVNQGRDMLLAATGVELDPTDVPQLARVVDDRADLVVPRSDRLTILQQTVARLELAGARVQEAPLRPDAGRIVPAAFARELQDWLFRISLKRTITTGADVHLQHTVTLAQRMAQLPPADPGTRRYQRVAVTMLLSRAQSTAEVADLDTAIALLRSLLAASEAGPDNDHALLTVSLGYALIERFRLSRDPADRDSGLDLIEATLREATESGTRSPELVRAAAAAFLEVPGRAGRERAGELLTELPPSAEANIAFMRLAALPDDAARTAVRHAVAELERLLDGPLTLPPTLVFAARKELGRQALRAGDQARALAAFAAARSVFSDLYDVQALPTSRERALGIRHDLAVAHAFALTRAGRIEAAVDVLEESRARLLSEALDLDTADLASIDPTVAGRYREAARRVRELTLDGSGDLTRSAEVDAARVEVRKAIAEVRAQPGAEGFLTSSGLAEARRAAASGRPVVYLAAAEPGGFAVIVDPDPQLPPRLVDLPALSRQELVSRSVELLGNYRARTHAWPRELRSVISWLGTAAMEPLAAALDGADEVVLIAMDLLGLLPLQAACRFAVAHAPSARSWLAAREIADAATTGQRLLMVAVTRPDDDPRLNARLQVSTVAAHFPDVVTHTTREAVLAALGDRDVLHFACHGAADPESPRQSRLALADGPLTVADLMATPVRARLAVLSACETAMIGVDALDEVVGLPAGLLQAGCGGVLGTLWRVESLVVALLVARFYDAWRAEGQPPVRAVRTAQRWLRDCTNEDLHRRYPALRPEPDRDPADVVFWRETRPFTAPEHWAALQYVGA